MKAQLPRLTSEKAAHQLLGVIGELLYEHLIELVDWDRLKDVEAHLFHYLRVLKDAGQLAALSERDLVQHTDGLMRAAWLRMADDPRRFYGKHLEDVDDEDDEVASGGAGRGPRHDTPRRRNGQLLS